MQESERETDLGGLKLPEGDVDGDTALALGLQLVEDPRVLERTCEHARRSVSMLCGQEETTRSSRPTSLRDDRRRLDERSKRKIW